MRHCLHVLLHFRQSRGRFYVTLHWLGLPFTAGSKLRPQLERLRHVAAAATATCSGCWKAAAAAPAPPTNPAAHHPLPHQAALLLCHPSPALFSVKAMEVDEKPTEDYSDIGGLDKQVRAFQSIAWW